VEQPEDDRNSGMRIAISVGIEYTRKRPDTHDPVEARIGTIGLIVIGGIVTLFVVLFIIPRIIEGIHI